MRLYQQKYQIQNENGLFTKCISFEHFLRSVLFRSISEVSAPLLSVNPDEKNKSIKQIDEQIKKVKKLSETTGEICAQNFLSNVLPAEMDADIKPCIDKLVRVNN